MEFFFSRGEGRVEEELLGNNSQGMYNVYVSAK
jgi:hypothetical protein